MNPQTAILFFLILVSSLSFGQTAQQIDSLLSALTKTQNSKEISTEQEAIKIISYGKNVLPLLAEMFDDNTSTEIYSNCQNLNLTRGEVAIILADRIEYMPYAKLTNVQNCLMAFCENNPNLIEYYLYTIRRDNVKEFQGRYKDWLTSKDRRNWPSNLNSKKKKTK
jgi:hypothetical protein